MRALMDLAKRFLEEHTTGVREKTEWRAFLKRYHLPRSVAKREWSMDARDFEAIFDVVRHYQASETIEHH